MEVLTAPSPDAYNKEPGETDENYARRQFVAMEPLLAEAEEICAVVVEPMIQCAGGMRMHHPVYHTLLRDACNRYGVHLIADEIAVGFGHTGTLLPANNPGSPRISCAFPRA